MDKENWLVEYTVKAKSSCLNSGFCWAGGYSWGQNNGNGYGCGDGSGYGHGTSCGTGYCYCSGSGGIDGNIFCDGHGYGYLESSEEGKGIING